LGAFVVGVVSALAASALLALVGWLATPRTRWFVIRRINKLTGSDVEAVFDSQEAANSILQGELLRAIKVDIFAGRGYEFLRETFAPLWQNGGRNYIAIRILLPDPEQSGPGSWFADRQREIAEHDTAYADDLLVQQVKANLAFLAHQAASNSKIEIRVYDFPHLGRVIATDRSAFLTPYSAIAHGRSSSTIFLRPPGPLYDLSRRIFEKAWMSSRVWPEASNGDASEVIDQSTNKSTS
jgi:hypothetical protein